MLNPFPDQSDRDVLKTKSGNKELFRRTYRRLETPCRGTLSSLHIGSGNSETEYFSSTSISVILCNVGNTTRLQILSNILCIKYNPIEHISPSLCVTQRFM